MPTRPGQREHRRLDVVGVDLVAGEEQLLRPPPRVPVRAGEDLVHSGQCVPPLGVRLAAGAVHDPDVLDAVRRHHGPGPAAVGVTEPAGRAAEQAQRAEVLGGAAVWRDEGEVVLDQPPRRERHRRPSGDDSDVQEAAERPGPGCAFRADTGPTADPLPGPVPGAVPGPGFFRGGEGQPDGPCSGAGDEDADRAPVPPAGRSVHRGPAASPRAAARSGRRRRGRGHGPPAVAPALVAAVHCGLRSVRTGSPVGRTGAAASPAA